MHLHDFCEICDMQKFKNMESEEENYKRRKIEDIIKEEETTMLIGKKEPPMITNDTQVEDVKMLSETKKKLYLTLINAA